MKTIPANVLSEHKNQVETFERNFLKTPMKTYYASEDEKQFKFNKSAERLFTDKTTQQNTKMDVKEIIEQHAEI